MTDYRRALSEEAKMRTLKRIVDDCAARLKDGNISHSGAMAIIEETRRKVLNLFPGKDEQFELIYRPRFMRILKEKSFSTGEAL